MESKENIYKVTKENEIHYSEAYIKYSKLWDKDPFFPQNCNIVTGDEIKRDVFEEEYEIFDFEEFCDAVNDETYKMTLIEMGSKTEVLFRDVYFK